MVTRGVVKMEARHTELVRFSNDFCVLGGFRAALRFEKAAHLQNFIVANFAVVNFILLRFLFKFWILIYTVAASRIKYLLSNYTFLRLWWFIITLIDLLAIMDLSVDWQMMGPVAYLMLSFVAAFWVISINFDGRWWVRVGLSITLSFNLDNRFSILFNK